MVDRQKKHEDSRRKYKNESGFPDQIDFRETAGRRWWALRDSNPEPRDYESPALTVAPRALVVSGCDSNGGYPFALVSHHEEEYYHARDGRSTHDLVDQENQAFAFVLAVDRRPSCPLPGAPSGCRAPPHRPRRSFSKIVLASPPVFPYSTSSHGGVAQLGERLTGSQEVRGSIPLVSTRALKKAPTQVGAFFHIGIQGQRRHHDPPGRQDRKKLRRTRPL